MWKIGDIEINGKVVLAPMAGITSLAYRKFMKPFGISLSYSEMVSAVGLIYQNEQTEDYVVSSKEDHPLAIQLFASTKEELIKGAQIVESLNPNYEIIDVNLACPVYKVTSAGSGASLLKDTAKLKEIITALVNSTKKPVTAKIRLGWDESSINFKENIKALEEAGVKAIALHVRTRKQGYSGEARYDLVKDLRSSMSVPLIISGDIMSLEDAINALKITGADACMVARGALGNPMLPKQIDHYFKTGEILPNPTLKENVKYLLEFTDLLIEEKGEARAMKILRGIAPKFLNGYPGMKKVKTQIVNQIVIKDDLIKILKENELV